MEYVSLILAAVGLLCLAASFLHHRIKCFPKHVEPEPVHISFEDTELSDRRVSRVYFG